MKRVLLVAVLLMSAFSLSAQKSDSEIFAAAPRVELKLPKGAKGYRIERVNLFSSVQTISVICYSPKRLHSFVVQPDGLAPLSLSATQNGAYFGVNAGYWDVRIDKPSTYLKLNGELIAFTADYEKERVDGLVCIGEKGIVIDGCKAGKEAVYAAKYDNILASGPMLIDEGKSVDHEAYTKNMVDSADGKPVGAFYTYTQRHPRTAIGTDKKGNVYLIVVDGRLKGNAEGVTISELTKVCEWLGLCDAMNLDGGGSSSMWSAKEGTVSYPCRNKKYDHAGERKVSSVWLVRGKK